MFLHGYLASKETFIYQTEFLKGRFRVIAVDITGFGKSPKITHAYSLDDYVSDVVEFINSLGIKSYHVVAHSFGARIAIKLARQDKRLKKLVLTGAAGLKPKRSVKYYFKVYSYKLFKRFLPSKKLKNFGSTEYKNLSGFMKESYVKIVNEHLDGYLKYIENKTLILFGENDKDTPLYMAKKFKKYIKNSTLHIIKNAGHFAFIDEPYVFNLYLSEFLLGE